MATPNYGTIPQGTLDEATLGVVQGEQAIADRVCRIRTDIKTLKGTAPFLTSQATVRSRENVDLAPGVDAIPASGGFGEVSYNCLRQTGFNIITDESEISASAYNIDLVAHWIEEAVKQANTNTDAKLEEVLSSTTLNLTWDVTDDGSGAWTDKTNGAPLTDITEAAKRVPNLDTAIIGREAIIAFQNSPQAQGRLSGYTNGTVAFVGEVRNLIASALNINPDQVFLLDGEDAIFNENGQGQDFSTGYVFSDGMWIGKKADLQLFDPNNPNNRKSEQGRRERGAATEIVHHRYVDIIRHVRENGLYFENILGA